MKFLIFGTQLLIFDKSGCIKPYSFETISTQIKWMIWIDTVFYIFDRQIITFLYKKKYSVKIRFIRLICVLITFLRQ